MDYREEYIAKVTKIKANAEDTYKRFIEEKADEHILNIIKELIKDCDESIEKMKNSINNNI